jgi:hypothetical protein
MKESGERHTQAALPPGKRHGIHCTGAGWTPGPVWMGVVNLVPTGFRTSNRLACSELLHLLRLPGLPARNGVLNFFLPY